MKSYNCLLEIMEFLIFLPNLKALIEVFEINDNSVEVKKDKAQESYWHMGKFLTYLSIQGYSCLAYSQKWENNVTLAVPKSLVDIYDVPWSILLYFELIGLCSVDGGEHN